MKTAGSHLFDPRVVSLLLAGGMCSLPFLQPRHLPPIRPFYDEWLAFALGLAAIGVASAGKSRLVQVPIMAVFLVLFALFVLAHAVFGNPAYAQSSFLWAIYAVFAALLVVLGHELASHFGQPRFCDVLAAFLVTGALANSFAGILQVCGIPPALESWISHLGGSRAVGNVGQSNLYANYLALGEASLIYLFARGKICNALALACGAVLVIAAALAASRASPVYAIGFALLACYAIRRHSALELRRLVCASVAVAAGVIAAQWLVPAGMNSVGFHMEGGFHRNAPSAWEGLIRDDATHLRLVAWQMAWQLFQIAPWSGVGPDAFAGAAFEHGLPIEMAGTQVWTSPHNIVLHLLAESGLIGTALVVSGVLVWGWGTARAFRRNPDAARWMLIACAGVECFHALVEYPLFYAHFLAITALAMGASCGPSDGVLKLPMATRNLFAAGAVAGSIFLGSTLVDYFKFDLASPVATGRSLASDRETGRDRATLAALSNGLLAPRSELWLFLSFPLDHANLTEKLSIGSRVIRFWPSRDVVVRQSVFLALAGRDEEAVSLIRKAVRSFGKQRGEIADTIRSAPVEAGAVLVPALSGKL